MMHVEDILLGMRSGQPQPVGAIEAFVHGVVDGSISRPQAAAWLAWAFARKLSREETVALTRAMTVTGAVLTWPEGPELVDKHSTGGVGDKVSLPLAALWAELGLRVPMISGRGLGHTGGTLDKLEAIPGYRCDLSQDELQVVLRDVGCFISGQTAEVAPADRVLYALRNEIQAVPSVPLVVASILSKKLAEGVQRLVLDVKTGSGAFAASFEMATELAERLVEVARDAGVRSSALITEMGSPLGEAVGNAIEVEESVACLRGEGPADLRALVLEFADHPRAAEVLDSGAALTRFERMVEAQGGDPRSLTRPGGLLGGGCAEEVLVAPRSGWVHEVDALAVGRAVFGLGAGRRRAEDPVDHGVGMRVLVKPGQRVERGQEVVKILHRDGHGLEEAVAGWQGGLVIGEEQVEAPPLVRMRVG
jgi:pyrimidine-nucleoside phosphorylase